MQDRQAVHALQLNARIGNHLPPIGRHGAVSVHVPTGTCRIVIPKFHAVSRRQVLIIRENDAEALTFFAIKTFDLRAVKLKRKHQPVVHARRQRKRSTISRDWSDGHRRQFLSFQSVRVMGACGHAQHGVRRNAHFHPRHARRRHANLAIRRHRQRDRVLIVKYRQPDRVWQHRRLSCGDVDQHIKSSVSLSRLAGRVALNCQIETAGVQV